MAIRINQYGADVLIPSFTGLMQYGDGVNLDMRYATEAVNCDTTGGTLKPMRTGASLGPITVIDDTTPVPIKAPIGTLMRLYRRFAATDNDVLVAVAGGNVYYKLPSSDYWNLCTLPDEHTITDNNFDFITYEVNREGSTTPTDVLLFTNNTDGMFCLYGDEYDISYVPIGDTGYRIGVLSRHYERIWGASIKDIAGDPLPDTLIYSQAYDPFNWTADAVVVADDAGEIDVPTWDGDSFVALRNYGSYLLAIKRDSIWRVMGTNPGDYVVKEQFGGGAITENTVAVDGYYVYMLGETGMMAYDGTEVRPYYQEYPKAVVDRINPTYRNIATAAMCNGTYYLAIPLDTSEVNNAVLEYNTKDKSFNLRSGVSVKSFLMVDHKLYYTSETNPYNLYLLDGGNALPLKWVSGWQDLNASNATKSGFEVYVSPTTETAFNLSLSIETEKKIKTKVYQVPKTGKYKRIRLANQGRKFRFIIETLAEVTNDWTLTGGVAIHLETDPD